MLSARLPAFALLAALPLALAAASASAQTYTTTTESYTTQPPVVVQTVPGTMTLQVAPSAPPAAEFELVPAAPSQEVVWHPGHWAWNGATWAWVPGQYFARPQTASAAGWIPGRWDPNGSGGYVWVEGHWSD